jgi:DNA-binding beta-propeller fold protein YncE
VAAVLGDAEHRVAVLGGREGMPRSLGSVYGGSVTRFLGGSLRGVVSRVIDTLGVMCNGLAVSRDGSTLLVSVCVCGTYAIRKLSVVDGSLLRVVVGEGDGPLQFREPGQLCIAPDGFVFVADYGNSRVQVLTPTLDFHGFFGQGQLSGPIGVCANTDVVVVSDRSHCRIATFDRASGAPLHHFSSYGTRDGQLRAPGGLCFMSGDRHVAVADIDNHRVSVFSVDGEFIRHVGVGVLSCPTGVVASAFNELVVTDSGNRCLHVFSSTGDLLASVGDEHFTGVAVHGSTVFATRYFSLTVSVLK